MTVFAALPRSAQLPSAAAFLGVLLAAGSVLAAEAEERVDYNRDIRPILSDKCYACHGPDENKRKAELRLDTKEGALGELASGGFAIVPGEPGESALVGRITAEEDYMRMPPEESGKQLTAEEVALLTRWIDEGAEWQRHWSFVKPERPEPPVVQHTGHVRNAIDRFILARLEKEGLEPSPEADKETLIRRVTLDLTGLPPTIEEIDAFLADDSPDAYEKVVDRLLRSPHYGEHMTRYWLDAARYGDTHGLHLDNQRSLWPYRDWVIRAFNENKPFDEFTVEQLAGDLLPEPTLEQRIATGFNRCNVTTSEGGSIPEEFRVRYAVDRVETTATVWMGLTAGCAVCHEHKYDPLSQKEFYELFAYFNSVDENPMDGNALLPPPIVRAPTEEQKREKAAIQAELADLDKAMAEKLTAVEYTDPGAGDPAKLAERKDYVWIEDGLPPGAKPQSSGGGTSGWSFVSADKHPVLSGEKASTRKATGLSQHFFTGASPGLKIGQGDVLFAHVYLDPADPPREIMLQFNDGSWEHRAIWGEDVIDWGAAGTASRRAVGPLPEAGKWVRLEVPAEQVGLKPGAVLNGWAFTQFDGTVYWDQAGIATSTPQGGRQYDSLAAWEAAQRGAPGKDLPDDVKAALKVEPDKRNDGQRKRLRDYFLTHVYTGTRDAFAPLLAKQREAKKRLDDLEKSIPGTMVMKELPKPRPAYLLIRGAYDKRGEQVEPGVPAALPPLPEDAPANRLGLAKWLVSPEHPLTSRVTVNRFWQRYFGTGIVRTAEDFGSQGEWPSHPRLLDWLAVEFMESGWDVKHMQKLIVTSATYRQSSAVRPELLDRDPENRLLARGPRYRMDAETIRDAALAISGLLVKKVGGPSVKPYQPLGLWKAVGYTDSNTANFVQDHGQNLFRRSMYTFWKRTSPPPSMSTFDAPSRESCTVRRERTNTPLQALVLMNDVQFVEAARHFAGRIMTEGGSAADDRITFAFRAALARRPDAGELELCRRVYESHLARYRKDPEAARKLVTVGESPRDESLDAAEQAAWTMIANLILNLDETITKG